MYDGDHKDNKIIPNTNNTKDMQQAIKNIPGLKSRSIMCVATLPDEL